MTIADKPPALRPPRDIAPRSTPRQERSRMRQDALLDAAEAIVGEAGLDGLAMREVGRRAGLPIASVYHYYPSAPALVRALAGRNLARVAAFARERLAQRAVEHAGGVAEIAAGMIDDVAAFVATLPALPAIWHAVRANPELRALDRADTLETASAIIPILTRIRPDASPVELEAQAIVILETVVATLLFAHDADAPLRKALIDTLRRMVVAAILDTASTNCG